MLTSKLINFRFNSVSNYVQFLTLLIHFTNSGMMKYRFFFIFYFLFFFVCVKFTSKFCSLLIDVWYISGSIKYQIKFIIFCFVDYFYNFWITMLIDYVFVYYIVCVIGKNIGCVQWMFDFYTANFGIMRNLICVSSVWGHGWLFRDFLSQSLLFQSNSQIFC